MNHKLVMQVAYCLQELVHKKRGFGLGQAFPTLDHFIHALIVAELQQDVAVLSVLEEMFILTNMFML